MGLDLYNGKDGSNVRRIDERSTGLISERSVSTGSCGIKKRFGSRDIGFEAQPTLAGQQSYLPETVIAWLPGKFTSCNTPSCRVPRISQKVSRRSLGDDAKQSGRDCNISHESDKKYA